jgi:epoxyqueuosine reductase
MQESGGTHPPPTYTLMESQDKPTAQIRAKALELGFEAVGFARAASSEQAREGLRRFLEAGHHGDMGWMAESATRRADPKAMWAPARSAIVLGANYGPDHDPLDDLGRAETGTISVYARNKDYHDLIKRRLKALGRWLVETQGGDARVFVDTAPLLEKPLAQAAGLGWQGKHTNLVSRGFGSWLFLGTVLTTLDLAPYAAETDHCGGCSRCLDICPTNAFPAPYRLDARRCISYLTIEHKGHIAAEFRAAMGNRIYGCDDCLAVCPWNKFAAATRHSEFKSRADLEAPALTELAALDDAAFRAKFAGSPIKRVGRDRFVRNVLIAIGNSKSAALVPTAEGLTQDTSPLVRAMAAWALKRLDPVRHSALARRLGSCETDAAVRTEWELV